MGTIDIILICIATPLAAFVCIFGLVQTFRGKLFKTIF